MLARAHQQQRPVLAAGQRAARQRGQQTGPDDRGLAAAGRADDAEQRRADELRDEVGDEPLAPAEVVGVGRLERCEALERADHQAAAAGGAACAPAQQRDTARQLVLHRAEPRASGSGLSDERADAPLRLVARPLGGDLLDARGDALGGGPEQLGGDRVGVGAGDERRRDRADRLDADRPELDRGVGPRAVHRRGALGDGEDAARAAAGARPPARRGRASRRRRPRRRRRAPAASRARRRAPGRSPAARPRPGRRRRRRARRRRAGGPPPRARRRSASARSRAGR